MSPSQPQQQLRYKCFPRVSGDEPVARSTMRPEMLFPRVSGDEPEYQELGTSSCFPRVSGDEPWAGIKTAHVLLFSPRERG
mgnify:CR=1 FL=1